MEDSAWAAYERVALMVVRLFYDLDEYYVMKALLAAPRQQRGDVWHPELQLDTDIATRLRMTQEYVRRLLARLLRDHLIVRTSVKQKKKVGEEVLSGPLAGNEQQFLYGLDFERLVDAVLWKLDSMERKLQQKKNQSMAVYRCPRCQASISELDSDFAQLMDFVTGVLSCPTQSRECQGVELEKDDLSGADVLAEAHRVALEVQLAGLKRALHQVSDVPPPAYKRPRVEEDAAGGGGPSGNGGAGRSGGGAGSSRQGADDGPTLGASRGIAAAIGSGAAAKTVVPWLQSKEEAAEAKAALVSAQTGPNAEEEAKQKEAEAEFMRKYQESKAKAEAEARARAKAEADAKAAKAEAEAAAAAAATSAAADDEEGEDEDEFEEEVMVGGVPKPISEVTQEDIDRMSDAEHKRYYELYDSMLE